METIETIPRKHNEEGLNVTALRDFGNKLGTKETPRAHRLVRVVASQLRPGNLNVRFWESTPNRVEVEKFARSIKKQCVFDAEGNLFKSGVLDPIKVFNDSTEALTLCDGESRWRAVRLLEGFDVLTGQPVQAGTGVLEGIEAGHAYETPQVPPDVIWFDAQIVTKMDDEAQRRILMMTTNMGRNYSTLELVEHINALMKNVNMPQGEIAEQLGEKDSYVSQILKLNLVTPDVRPYLIEGIIKPTTAINAIEDYGPEEAMRRLLAEIDSGKGEAADDYAQAIEEARLAQIEVDNLIAAGGRDRQKLEAATRTVARASSKATRAKHQMKHGKRVTARRLRDRTPPVAADKSDAKAPDTPSNRFSRESYNRLLDAVRFAAGNSPGPHIREAMNDALKKCGHELVAPKVDDKGEPLPVEGEAGQVAA